jgi:hypothetical protein
MMKTMALVALTGTALFAAAVSEKVTSRQGSVELRGANGEIICTAPFGEQMVLLKTQGDQALVKALCDRGWVQADKIQKVAAPAKDKDMTMSNVEVQGYTDLNYLRSVFGQPNYIDPPTVEITRDFRDFLTHTIDRESQERTHGEN